MINPNEVLTYDQLKAKCDALEYQLLAVREARSVRVTPEDITEIMAQEWSEWCADTGNFPDDFEWRGGNGLLSYEPSRWSQRVAERILKLTAPPAPAPAVPDAIEPTIEAIKAILPTANPDEYACCVGADMWNACRAAMLSGGAPCKNE